MHCPVCASKETKVTDSRVTTEGLSIKRRRECMVCKYRFSTIEEMELLGMHLILENGQ